MKMLSTVLCSVLLSMLSLTVAANAALDQLLEKSATYQADVKSYGNRLKSSQAKVAKSLLRLDKASVAMTDALNKVAAMPEDDGSTANADLVREATNTSMEFNLAEQALKRHQARVDKLKSRISSSKKKIAGLKRQHKSREKSLAVKKKLQQQPDVKKKTIAKAKPRAKKPNTAADWPHLGNKSSLAVAYAKRRMAELNRKRTSGDIGVSLIKDVELEGGFNNTDEEFSYLGQDLFITQALVKSGGQSFRVMRQNFFVSIPPEDNGANYVFIYDIERISKPRLIMFNQALLK